MIKISTRGQYALMTMEVLAEQTDDSYVPMKKISHKQNLSVKYLEQILIQLSKAGLVEGMRGNNGGYRLKNDSNAVKTLGNEEFWNGFDNAINSYVDSVSLEEILEKSRENNGYMYYI